MIYCLFRNDTIIEKLIKQKHKNKFNFEKKILIKVQKENEENLIAENNVETDFVEKASIMMSKII